MLLTMEYNSREACHLFPSPERLDKIQDSMSRLEQVIHERNDAYWQLEIGENAPTPRTVKSLDPTDPLAAVRDPIAAVTQVKDRATLKFQYLIKEKERKLARKQQRYSFVCFNFLINYALSASFFTVDFNELLKKIMHSNFF